MSEYEPKTVEMTPALLAALPTLTSDEREVWIDRHMIGASLGVIARRMPNAESVKRDQALPRNKRKGIYDSDGNITWPIPAAMTVSLSDGLSL